MNYTIFNEDCLIQLKEIEDNSIDSIVTDPPYEISFMSKGWDGTGIAFNTEVWEECLRVLKPGGHILAFGGTRTYHRMTVAIEDAGFEIRDCIFWTYASGFPKSHNIEKTLNKKADERKRTEHNLQSLQETNIQETFYNKETENDLLQQELQEQNLSSSRNSTSNVWEGQSKLEGGNNKEGRYRELQRTTNGEMSERIRGNEEEQRICSSTQISNGSTLGETFEENRSGASHRRRHTQQQNRKSNDFFEQFSSQEIREYAEKYKGFGTSLKPAVEPVVMGRKPFKGSVAQNVLEHGTGGLNIDECRIATEDYIGRKGNPNDLGVGILAQYDGRKTPPTKKVFDMESNPLGRFPANLILDVEAGKILDEQSGTTKSSKRGAHNNKKTQHTNTYTPPQAMYSDENTYGDTGGASRFFYCPKTSKKERNEGLDTFETKSTRKWNGGMKLTGSGNPRQETGKNNHPTVKPSSLLQYLIRLITPKGGVVLDPFMGSGSTGKAAMKEGMDFIGIEREEEYFEIAQARIEWEKNNNTHHKFFG